MKDTIDLIIFLARMASDQRRPRMTIALFVAAGIVGGAGNAVLIAMVNSAIARADLLTLAHAALFLTVCALVAASRYLSQLLLARTSTDSLRGLRMQLCMQILAAPLCVVEQIGPARILAHLTDDVGTLSESVVRIPVLLVNITIMVGSFIYLACLSPTLLLLILILMVTAGLIYQRPVRVSTRHFRQARLIWGDLFRGFQSLLFGIKEIQLHGRRRLDFYERKLLAPAESVRQESYRGYCLLAAANSYGQIMFFVIVGAIVFLAPRLQGTDPSVVTGYALVLLFSIGPLESILNAMPAMARARVALEQLSCLRMLLPPPQRPTRPLPAAFSKWRNIELRAISHTFRTERQDTHFTLGPLDFSLRPAEIVFIVGGNGSGKTTLAKVLTGLYQPQAGSIAIDGVPVEDHNLEQYRQLFSAIFSDFHLFDDLLGVITDDIDERARHYLQLLQLDHKLKIEQGVFSTTDLSQGQRKRLALLTAYLEDRSIYVFDEWSADQDPAFREVFYRHLLPSLKESGKAVVVITHDDRYFAVADRVIRLDYGQVRAA